MSRCPVCESAQILVVLNSRPRGFCPRCGSRWAQNGSAQRNVVRAEASPAYSASQSEVARMAAHW